MTYTEAEEINASKGADAKFIDVKDIGNGIHRRWIELPNGMIGFVAGVQQDTGDILIRIPCHTKHKGKYEYCVNIIKSEDWRTCKLIGEMNK